MTLELSRRSVEVCRALARAVSGAVGALGLAVLAGWIFDLPLLRSLVAGWPEMKPNTAVALALAAGAVWSLTAEAGATNARHRALAAFAAVGVAAIGALTLAQFVLRLNLNIDGLLVSHASPAATPWPGRMSPLVAADFLVLSIALLLIAGATRTAAIWTAQVLSLLAAAGAFVVITGYLYGREQLELARFFTDTAVHTAAALLVLSLGVVCARPEHGLMALFNAATAGGTMLRRLLLPVVLLPMALNWAELESERRGLFPPSVGWMVDSAVSVLLVGGLVWVVALIVHEKDVARDIAERELRRSEERYRQLIEASPLAIIVKDGRRIEFANPAALALVGAATADEVQGESPFAFVHPESRAAFEDGVCRVVRDGTPILRQEHKLLRLDGSDVDIELSATPVDYHGRRLAQVVATDISERKRLDTALRASVERLQLLAHATGDAIWDWDVVHDATWWSDTFFETFGYARDTVPSFDAWLDHVHPEDRERATAEFRSAVTQKTAGWSSEYRFRLANGSYGVIFDRAYAICDAAGTLVRTVGSMIDITSLRRAEEQARLVAHAVEGTSDLISITDLDDRFRFVNRAFLDAYGYTPNEVLGRTPEMLSAAPRQAPPTITSVRASLLEGNWSGVLLNRRKDGTEFPIHLNASQVRDAGGRVVALLGVAQDITARVRAEETLHESEARFRATFEQAALGMSITAMDGRFLQVNQKLCGITGYEADELLDRTFQEITHPADVALDVEQVARLIAGDSCSYTMPKRYVRKDRSVVWVELTSSLVRRRDGTPDYFIDLVEDITERRDLEAQLRQSQKMEAIGQLAGGVAHDFNNLLTIIRGHADLAGLSSELPAPVRESLDQICLTANRAADLTRRMLLFSRREVMQPARVDLNDVVTQLAKMLRRLIGENVRVTLDVHQRPLPIYADAGMIEQVLMNLAINARDAMTGGGTLSIETSESTERAATADISEVETGTYACISVRDTGCGIPPDVLPRIFEPFFTTKEAGRGTGLGLAMVFGVVKQHRGWVTVDSEPGRGATFRVYLPLTERPAAMERPAMVATAQRGRGETILVAEDDEPTREMTRAILERHGYRVVGANSGRDALRRWAEADGPIDVLLTDMVMPGGVSGTDLAGELQQKQANLKVILTSGYSTEIAGRALDLREGQTFLRKPFGVTELLTTIANVLGSSTRSSA